MSGEEVLSVSIKKKTAAIIPASCTQPRRKANTESTCHKQTRSITPRPTRPHAQAQEYAATPIAAGCSHHFPASKARAQHPAHSKFCRANETHEWGLRNAKRPTPRAHARIAKSRTQPALGRSGGSEQKEAHLLSSSASPFTRISSHGIHTGSGFTPVCFKYRLGPPSGRCRPDVLGPLRPTAESGGLRRVVAGPARALASTNDLYRVLLIS